MVKNSLAGLASTDNSKNTLPTGESPQLGRKAKPVAEKARNPITLKFTDAELKIINEQAGLTAKATYLKHLLLAETQLFNRD